MKKTLDQIPALKQKDAVIAQIKHCKSVLGTKPYNKTLLQLQSGKEKFIYDKLATNLENVLMSFSQQPVLASGTVNIRQQKEWEEELCAAIIRKQQQQKRKQQEEHLSSKLVDWWW